MKPEPAKILQEVDVSRETIEKLETYHDLLLKWTKTINLISRNTHKDIWTRHILDSALAFKLAEKKAGKWIDLGSGAGLPGMILAIIAAEKIKAVEITCVEADGRKAEFLRSVARQLNLEVTVLSKRIENVKDLNADVIFSRALAPLETLLHYASQHLSETGICVLHKGRGWKSEVETARASWQFTLETKPSRTETSSALLEIGDIKRA